MTLTGRRGVSILYAYMLLGLGLLRIITPDFGDLTSQQQQLEGTFRLLGYFIIGILVSARLYIMGASIVIYYYFFNIYSLGSCMRGCGRMLNLLLSLGAVLEKKRYFFFKKIYFRNSCLVKPTSS